MSTASSASVRVGGRAGESSSDCVVVERTRKHLFFPDVKNRERRGG
jgi:hypothetical protein